MRTVNRHVSEHVLRRVAVLLVVAVLTNVVIGNMFGTYANLPMVAWEDFEETNHVDCLFVGASYAQRTFDPVAYDAIAGTSSINLSTAEQSLEESMRAIEAGIHGKSIKRVILGIGVESFAASEDGSHTDDVLAQSPDVCAKLVGGPAQMAFALLELATGSDSTMTKDSGNMLFPWTSSSIRDPTDILSNMSSRINGIPLGEAAEKVTPSWHYVGKGYGNYDHVLDAQSNETTAGTYGVPVIDSVCLAQLEKLCDLCLEHEVDLVVVATPHPAYDILSTGTAYPECMRQVQSVVEEHGATYMDLSLTRDGVLPLGNNDFGDYEHLNLTGARKTTLVLADILRRHDAGEDVSSLFYPYDEWDAWLAAHVPHPLCENKG